MSSFTKNDAKEDQVDPGRGGGEKARENPAEHADDDDEQQPCLAEGLNFLGAGEAVLERSVVEPKNATPPPVTTLPPKDGMPIGIFSPV